jgi:pyruvate/2-oxoglutarate dehydrogenase complex dihydrolipoamide acyltransferase (E2) component
MNKEQEYTFKKFPSSRQSTFDVGYISVRKHHMKALIELDVTDARKMIRDYRRQKKEKISFMSWVLKCIGQAVSENKEVHGIRKGKSGLIIFDDIDISIAVEKVINGEKVPLPVVIRKVNEKTMQEINYEIRSAQEQEVKDEKDYILGESRYKGLMKFYVTLPSFIRLAIWRLILKRPFLIKKMSGTIVVTSIGMMGNIKGWAIPATFLPLSFVLGSIVKKPGVVDDRIEIREYLHMSIAIDHDVVDGAPATRFVSRLAELIEKGYGLL